MSPAFSRRDFFASTTSYAAALAAGPMLIGREPTTFAPDTLFLTWQRDPTTTMTVSWIGRAGDCPDATIRFRKYIPKEKLNWANGPIAQSKAFPVVDRLEIRAIAERTARERGETPKPVEPDPPGTPRFTGPTDYSVFRAELTNLTPGTEYEFTIGTASPAYRFRTMPAKATDSFHFISGGDCGVNSHVIANNRIAAVQDPMFALIGGDLGYDNGLSGNTALMFIRNYSQTMIDSKGRLIPLVTCLGNHEVKGGFGKTLNEATFFTPLFGGLYSETSYSTLDFGDYLSLILLDSGHCAKIPGEQTAWLNGVLRERTGKTHLIPVNHVPCYPSYREPEGQKGKLGTGEEQRKHWVPLFEKYNVDVVLEHHDHTFKRTHPLTGGSVDTTTGIVYLGDGSWGRLRVPKEPEKRGYLNKISASYHLTLHQLEGEQRFHLALGESGKVYDIYRTGKKPRHRTPGVTTG
jgi:hypothetical protein